MLKPHEISLLEQRICERYEGKLIGYLTVAQAINPTNEANWFVHYTKHSHGDIYEVAKNLQNRLKLEELLTN